MDDNQTFHNIAHTELLVLLLNILNWFFKIKLDNVKF